MPAELRTAMIVGGRECDVVGCHARGYLEVDHCEIDYAKGGPTARWNLAWLCAVHHRRKTKGWKLGPRDGQTGKRTLRAPDIPPGETARHAEVSRR
jgi:5-methylcytosine-specific restriction endonuclease McrA